MAHIYPILLHIARYSCLLVRTIRVGVTPARFFKSWQVIESKICTELTFPLTTSTPP
jgi:hypothetical protein